MKCVTVFVVLAFMVCSSSFAASIPPTVSLVAGRLCGLSDEAIDLQAGRRSNGAPRSMRW